MKKTFSAIIGLFILLMLPGVSLSATPGPYVSGQLGATFLNGSNYSEMVDSDYGKLEFKPGYAVGIAGGYNFGMFRVEGEIGYQKNDMDTASDCSGGTCITKNISSSDITALSFLINGYVDFVNSSRFTPYISGGIGMATLDYNIKNWSDNDTVFAYQVGAGVAFAINKHFTIDLKYRFFATEELETTIDTFESHNVYLGVRYNF
jgi:opacity protein-like surface antigen